MHELAVAQSMIEEAARVALLHRAEAIEHILVRVGALSGVEPPLLERAFTVARAGTLADWATLTIEVGPVGVRCTHCGAQTQAAPNKIVCGACGDWRVRVVSGEELLLIRVELAGVPVEPAVETPGGASN